MYHQMLSRGRKVVITSEDYEYVAAMELYDIQMSPTFKSIGSIQGSGNTIDAAMVNLLSLFLDHVVANPGKYL